MYFWMKHCRPFILNSVLIHLIFLTRFVAKKNLGSERIDTIFKSQREKMLILYFYVSVFFSLSKVDMPSEFLLKERKKERKKERMDEKKSN